MTDTTEAVRDVRAPAPRPEQQAPAPKPSLDWQTTLRPGAFSDERFEAEARRFMDQANEIETEIADRVASVNADDRLSARGKAERKRELLAELQPKVDELKSRAEGVEKARQKTLAAIAEPDPDPADALSAIRMREVRDLLRQKSHGEVLRLYQEAVTSGDMELIRAVEGAPKSFPVADPQAVAKLRETRLEQSHPETIAKAKNQSALHAAVQSAAQHLERKVKS